MRSLFLVFLVNIMLAANILSCSEPLPVKTISYANVDCRVPTEMTILFGGDYMQHAPQLSGAMNVDGSYDFLPTLRYMDSLWSSADFVALNFETTIGTENYSGYPCFVSPVECMSALKESGADIIFTANNHCCDGGGRGLVQTIDCADSLGLMHIGTYKDGIDYKRNRILYVEKNGIRVAIMNYTYGTNGIAVPKGRYVNKIDTSLIKSDLSLAAGADLRIVVVHWGWEYDRAANIHQKSLAKSLRTWGADVIVGAHPHVVQPAEIYMDQDSCITGALFYSLGNFISNQRDRYRDGGINVKLYIGKDVDGSVYLGVESVPVWVYKYYSGGKYRYAVLPEYVRGNVKIYEYDSLLFERSIKDNELQISNIVL